MGKEKFQSNNKKDVKTLTKQQRNRNSKLKKNSPNPANEGVEEPPAEEDKPAKEDKPEEEETAPFKLLMQAMTKGFTDVKSKIEENKTTMDILNGRFQMLEKANKDSETCNKQEFDNIRREIKNTTNELEDRITNRVLDKLKPQIEENNMNTNENLRRLVQDELQLQNFKNNKPEPAKCQPTTGIGSAPIDAEKPKTSKSKKQRERKQKDDEI